MAIPAEASIFEEALDPADIMDFEVDLAPLLAEGENVATQTVSLPAESALLGLELRTTDGYATTLIGNVLRMWLSVALEEQGNPAFVDGVVLPIEITITTTSTPPRKKQRTVAVTVIQR